MDARKRSGRMWSPGAGIPRSSCGDGWHPPAPRVSLPYLEGVTDRDCNLLKGRAMKAGMKQIRDRERELGRASETGTGGSGQLRLRSATRTPNERSGSSAAQGAQASAGRRPERPSRWGGYRGGQIEDDQGGRGPDSRPESGRNQDRTGGGTSRPRENEDGGGRNVRTRTSSGGSGQASRMVRGSVGVLLPGGSQALAVEARASVHVDGAEYIWLVVSAIFVIAIVADIWREDGYVRRALQTLRLKWSATPGRAEAPGDAMTAERGSGADQRAQRRAEREQGTLPEAAAGAASRGGGAAQAVRDSPSSSADAALHDQDLLLTGGAESCQVYVHQVQEGGEGPSGFPRAEEFELVD